MHIWNAAREKQRLKNNLPLPSGMTIKKQKQKKRNQQSSIRQNPATLLEGLIEKIHWNLNLMQTWWWCAVSTRESRNVKWGREMSPYKEDVCFSFTINDRDKYISVIADLRHVKFVFVVLICPDQWKILMYREWVQSFSWWITSNSYAAAAGLIRYRLEKICGPHILFPTEFRQLWLAL